ncbi:MAG: MFS transporter [Caldimonas sp.]
MTSSPDASEVGAARLSRARRATRIEFAVLGMFAGTWGAHIPSVKAHFGLDEARLGWVLLAAAVGAVGALLIAGRAVERLGTRNAALAAGCAVALSLAAMLQMPGLLTLLPVAFVLGAGTSLFDVAINSEGSELEILSQRAIMSNLHAMFSVGGMLGAGLVALLLRLGIAPALQLALIALALASVVIVGTRGMLERRVHGASDAPASFIWPRGALLLIGLLILAGMMAEGVMYDWCVLYLKQELGMAPAPAVLGYAAFSASMALARFCGDPLRQRYPEQRLLLVGGAMAGLAMAAVLLLRNPTVAIIGFALVGAGLAPVAPILYNAATRVPGVGRAAAIASVTAIGYGGFMIGPPLIGGLAHATSLTAALVVVVAGAALLAFAARPVMALVPAPAPAPSSGP